MTALGTAPSDHNAAAQLLDVHNIQQILLLYAVSMDSHQWDLMDNVFLDTAEVHLSRLGAEMSGGVSVMDAKGWQAMCRRIDATFDAIQHFLYQPLIKIEGNTAQTRTYYVSHHVKNAHAPNPFFTLGGWYNHQWEKNNGAWRISRQAAANLWFAGNPAVVGHPSLPLGALPRNEGHAVPPWLK